VFFLSFITRKNERKRKKERKQKKLKERKEKIKKERKNKRYIMKLVVSCLVRNQINVDVIYDLYKGW
jgi:hypothetical protein